MEPSLETRTILHTADATTRQAERLFQLAVESAPHAILMWDADCRILLANPETEKLFGYSRRELLGEPVEILLSGDAWSACSPALPSALTTRELRGRHKDGSRFPVEIVLNPIQTGEGDWVVATVVDLTERKRAEASLRESEERFRAIFSHAGVGLAQARLDGVLDFVNDRLCRMLGYSQSELLGKNVLEITHPDDRHLCTGVISRLLTGELSSPSIEKRYLCKDGSSAWIRLFPSLVRDPDGLPKYLIALVEDISARVNAERALRDSEMRLTLAQGAAPIGVWDWDLRNNAVTVSGAYMSLYGLPDDHPPLEYKDWLERLHPDDRESLQAQVSDALERTHCWDSEFRVRWPDGSVHWLLGRGSVFLDEGGRPIRMAGANLDITERKRSEEALRESEERFRNLADSAPVLIWLADTAGQVTFFNRQALLFTGCPMEGLAGNNWTALLHAGDLERVRATFALTVDAREGWQCELRLRRADGAYRWMLCTAIPRWSGLQYTGHIGIMVDITEFKRNQEQVQATQKLESLGVLAGGIAHDFNNLLGSILAAAELAAEEFPAGSPASVGIESIRAVAVRAAEIVRQLMEYAGQETAAVEPVDLSRLVGEMLELLKVSISKHATLEVDLTPNLPAVRGSAAQIRQLALNLITNASEALGESDGTIAISTSWVRLGARSRVQGAPSLPPGKYVRLEVKDSGCGMTAEVQARMFEPFFTTKFTGRGLGLAAVQGIVRRHDGSVHVTSVPGGGTRFEIYLPAAGQPGRTVPLEKPASPAEAAASHGTVLIVEDEEPLRLAVSKMLRRQGFSVFEARDGTAAIDVFRRLQDQIDVILLDMTIPGRSSRDVVDEARRIRPDVKVILTTAYSREATASFEAFGVRGFIRKPYQVSDLVRLLRDTLAG